MTIQEKVSIIGGGNMGDALVRGLIQTKTLSPKQLLIAEPRKERKKAFLQKYNLSVTNDNRVAARSGEIIILAIKPQIMKEVLEEIYSEVTSKQLIISIAAGISIAFIVSYLGEDRR
ncbi:MAG: NAD(P)-binding domain-containing protein, partial [Desulfobacterota bacterium]|nr:NAD(P)-binding domain-containing protein [Thermodesulfobacteriota bacterium]